MSRIAGPIRRRYLALVKPPRRNQRLAQIALIGAGLAAGAVLVFSALGENTQFFYNPADVVAADFEPKSTTFRIGGLVADGSVEISGISTRFDILDFEREAASIRVNYTGQLPNLFREGQGVVVSGRLIGPTEFQADKVLAKHDENYQPKIAYEDEKPS